ncbi:MAG: hypothetical protein ACD_20C00316G0012 [uncultured bacterium]|nr:MAG: hypothetical protein ACD_20C00316G0012 [uncultured bacterium]HBH18809.1 hypothetical protein [Cyanobacteria bacterium UBA9579]
MRKGFTLLELLIVVVILGILALIAAPTLLDAANRARNGAVQANVSAAASSITSRFATTTNTSEEIAAAVIANLNTNNVNPIAGSGAAYAASDTTEGTVTIVGDDTADAVTITGYGVGSAVLVTKVIESPQ